MHVSPHLDNFSADDRRLLPGDHIAGNCHADQHRGEHAGPEQVAGTLGVVLATGGVVELGGILPE